LENPIIYHKTLAIISSNYESTGNGMKENVKKPFVKLSNENALQWDAVPYNILKEQGYGNHTHEYIFAFFPLFPTIWKISALSPVGILFLNFLMYVAGMLLLIRLFKKDFITTLLLLSLPCIVIFFIPYTEATFSCCLL
jgi:hypothetical protein